VTTSAIDLIAKNDDVKTSRKCEYMARFFKNK